MLRKREPTSPDGTLLDEVLKPLAPGPTEILALAVASLADISASDLRLLTRRLKEPVVR